MIPQALGAGPALAALPGSAWTPPRSVPRDRILARYGDERFVMLLPECTVESARAVAEGLTERVANSPLEFGPRACGYGRHRWRRATRRRPRQRKRPRARGPCSVFGQKSRTQSGRVRSVRRRPEFAARNLKAAARAAVPCRPCPSTSSSGRSASPRCSGSGCARSVKTTVARRGGPRHRAARERGERARRRGSGARRRHAPSHAQVSGVQALAASEDLELEPKRRREPGQVRPLPIASPCPEP